jgi:hypothetical protein
MKYAFIFGFIGTFLLGGICGFFVGNGRKIEVSTRQETHIDTRTIQNTAQVTVVNNRETKDRLHYARTNIRRWEDVSGLVDSFDDFQKEKCHIVNGRGKEFLVIYPVYNWTSKTNTIQVVNTNTTSDNKIDLK